MISEKIANGLISVEFQETVVSIGHTAEHLRTAKKHKLAYSPWQDKFPYMPEVQVAISYSHNSLYLQYEVKEKEVRAFTTRCNGPVYQDSCVEFFVSFNEEDSYYNFEFNCIGTVLAAYGKGRDNREWLDENLLGQIQSQSVIRKEGLKDYIFWELTVEIPYAVFQFHPVVSLQGQQCKANFYKCGDHLSRPHFLCWSDIKNNEPDFHLPRFFGTLCFV